jgi:hypothetical protein
LEHAALIGVEEVFAFGDTMSVLRTHRAALPAGWANAPAVLARLFNEMNTVFNAVL